MNILMTTLPETLDYAPVQLIVSYHAMGSIIPPLLSCKSTSFLPKLRQFSRERLNVGNPNL